MPTELTLKVDGLKNMEEALKDYFEQLRQREQLQQVMNK